MDLLGKGRLRLDLCRSPSCLQLLCLTDGNVRYLALDEADRMIDMGFEDEVDPFLTCLTLGMFV